MQRLRHAGEIPFVLIGRRSIRYRPEAIERWLESRQVSPGDELATRAREIVDDFLARM